MVTNPVAVIEDILALGACFTVIGFLGSFYGLPWFKFPEKFPPPLVWLDEPSVLFEESVELPSVEFEVEFDPPSLEVVFVFEDGCTSIKSE